MGLASIKASHSQLAKMGTCSEADANRACTDLRDSQARLIGVEEEAKLARKDPDKGREPSARLAKSTEESLRQLIEVSTRVGL